MENVPREIPWRTKSLSEGLQQSRSVENLIKSTMSMRIHEYKRDLPLELVKSMQGTAGVAERLCQIVNNALDNLYKSEMAQAFSVWRGVLVLLRQEEKERCAVIIESASRGFLARKLLLEMKRAQLRQIEIDNERREAREQRRCDSATRIQAHWRGCSAENSIQEHRGSRSGMPRDSTSVSRPPCTSWRTLASAQDKEAA